MNRRLPVFASLLSLLVALHTGSRCTTSPQGSAYGLPEGGVGLDEAPEVATNSTNCTKEAAGTAEPFRVSPPEAVVYPNGIMENHIAHYTCYRAAGPLVIDGRLDKPSWKLAPRSKPFIDIVTGKPAWFDTRVALLWDDTNLYFGFTVEETDVWATLTKRDSKIYQDNDVEVFIAGKDAYYEFEINALNTIYEVFWIWKDALVPGSPYYGRPEFDPRTERIMTLSGVGGHIHERGERWGFLDWDYPGLQHAVHIDGTLNSRNHTDKGWTVELAFPWEGLELLADGRPLPPKDGDIWRIDCSRFQHVSRDGRLISPGDGWTWNKHGHYDSHIPETFTYVHFSTRVVGSY